MGRCSRRTLGRPPFQVVLYGHDRSPSGPAPPHPIVVPLMSDAFDLEQTDRLLTTTRAVRKRLDLTRPVPRELILDCIRVATQAPAGGNVQRWRWIVVDEAALKSQLAELYRRAYRPYMDAQREAVQQTGRT